MKKLVFGIVALMTASTASADIIPTVSVTAPVQVGSLFRYDYTATLAADQALISGNFFTIYDFQGFVSFGTLGNGFAGSTSLLGRTPEDVIANDSGSVFNATFTYTGATLNMPGVGEQGQAVELGTFQIFSRFNGLGLIDFASQGIKNNGVAIGTPISNIGQTAGPLASNVPEPNAWAMLVIGFGIVGFSARRRQSALTAA